MQKVKKKWSTQLRETHFNTIVASVRLTGLTVGIEKLQHKIDSDQHYKEKIQHFIFTYV